jgi:ActR/RegA family two-component response regulator
MAAQSNIQSIPVLMVGNNPIELSRILERLKQLKEKEFITKIAFDVKSSLQCLATFTPRYIVIDDNIGKEELARSVQSFARKRATKNIPITILKNSNYEDTIFDGTFNYLLKANLTGELLYHALNNSETFSKAQAFLKKAYQMRKGKLKKRWAGLS